MVGSIISATPLGKTLSLARRICVGLQPKRRNPDFSGFLSVPRRRLSQHAPSER